MASRKRVRPLDRNTRLRILELAAAGYYDSPKDAVARARAYEAFVYGSAPKPKSGKIPISKASRKPLMIRRKKR